MTGRERTSAAMTDLHLKHLKLEQQLATTEEENRRLTVGKEAAERAMHDAHQKAEQAGKERADAMERLAVVNAEKAELTQRVTQYEQMATTLENEKGDLRTSAKAVTERYRELQQQREQTKDELAKAEQHLAVVHKLIEQRPESLLLFGCECKRKQRRARGYQVNTLHKLE